MTTFPAPLHTSVMPLRGPAPAVVGALASLAARHGWEYWITEAEGWVPHAITGKPGAQPKHVWAVRMRRGGQRAVAVRENDEWKSFWDWSSSQFFRRSGSLGEFKERLR